jgi:uncharacterized protein with GYD domain
MLTRLIGKEVHPSKQTLIELQQQVEAKIKKVCPEVKWLANYATFSDYDYVDIFEANDLETAFKVSSLVRSFGHASVEVWPALKWEDFKQIIKKLPDESKT